MNKESFISSPDVNFETVHDLMATKRLTSDEKIAALINWKSMCERLQDSADEGMQPDHDQDQADRLSEINEALAKLKH